MNRSIASRSRDVIAPLEQIPCEERLGELGAFSLEQRQLQHNLRAALSAYGEKICEMEMVCLKWGQVGR